MRCKSWDFLLYIGFERAGKCLICALLPQKLPLVCLTVCLILDARRSGLRAKKKPVRCVAGRAFVLLGVNLSSCVLLGYYLGGFHGRLLIAHTSRGKNRDCLVRHKAHAFQTGKCFAASNIIPTASDIEQINRTIPKFQLGQHFTIPPSSSLATLLPAFAAAASSAASFHRNPVSTLAVRLSPLWIAATV